MYTRGMSHHACRCMMMHPLAALPPHCVYTWDNPPLKKLHKNSNFFISFSGTILFTIIEAYIYIHSYCTDIFQDETFRRVVSDSVFALLFKYLSLSFFFFFFFFVIFWWRKICHSTACCCPRFEMPDLTFFCSKVFLGYGIWYKTFICNGGEN